MVEWKADPECELRVFRQLRASRPCCQTRLRCHYDQEEMLLCNDTRMFEPIAPPYSRPDPQAQAADIEQWIANAELRKGSKRNRRVDSTGTRGDASISTKNHTGTRKAGKKVGVPKIKKVTKPRKSKKAKCGEDNQMYEATTDTVADSTDADNTTTTAPLKTTKKRKTIATASDKAMKKTKKLEQTNVQ